MFIGSIAVCGWFFFILKPRMEIVALGPESLHVSGSFRVFFSRSMPVSKIIAFTLTPAGYFRWGRKAVAGRRFPLINRFFLRATSKPVTQESETTDAADNTSVGISKPKLVFLIIFHAVAAFYGEFFQYMKHLTAGEWGSESTIVFGMQAKQSELPWLLHILSEHLQKLKSSGGS